MDGNRLGGQQFCSPFPNPGARAPFTGRRGKIPNFYPSVRAKGPILAKAPPAWRKLKLPRVLKLMGDRRPVGL